MQTSLPMQLKPAPLYLLALFILGAASSVLQAIEPAPPKIAIQPLGKVKPDLIAQTKQSLERLYIAEVVVLPGKELPAETYYRPRDRYRADKLLDWLHAHTDSQYTKIVGLTEVDISTTKDDIFDWGIFGLGHLGARPCVISSFRLDRNVNRAKLLDRLGKVAGHEIGHTFGLDHCPTEGCLMRDAGGKVATVDGESGQFCDSCRQKIAAREPAQPASGKTGGLPN